MRIVNQIKGRKLSTGLVVLALAGGLTAGSALSGVHRASAAAGTPAALKIPSPVELSNTFSQLAKRLEPAVVTVTSTAVERPAADHRRVQPNSPDDLFRRFFGGEPFGDTPQRPFKSQGMGSGFIVDSKGFILTNNHVVDGATKIQVKLHGDSTMYTAKLIGRDPEMDVAVLKIEAGKPLPAVEIGNSDAVEVGDWAVAIGSPFGLDETVTAGIISAKGRDLHGADHQLQRFLQTDAAINPGNSGGPLINARGEVVGINTAIATESGGYQGIGFALPINTAAKVYDQIIKTGKVSRGAIGISFPAQDKPELLKAYGASKGVFVQEVTPGGPADKAGIKPEDIVTSYNGKPVTSGEDLVSRVSDTPVGSDVPVTVLRNGKTVNLTLRVGDRSEIVAGNLQPGDSEGSGRGEGVNVKFGISVQNLTPGLRQQLGYDGKGVVVADVQSGSFADDIGLREGDLITEINRQPVTAVADMQRIQQGLKPGDAVAFKVLRNASEQGRADWRPFFAAGTVPPANS